jgi:hypothetical protein
MDATENITADPVVVPPADELVGRILELQAELKRLRSLLQFRRRLDARAEHEAAGKILRYSKGGTP